MVFMYGIYPRSVVKYNYSGVMSVISKNDFEKYIKATKNKRSFAIEDCDGSNLDRSVFVKIAENFDRYLKMYKDNKLK